MSTVTAMLATPLIDNNLDQSCLQQADQEYNTEQTKKKPKRKSEVKFTCTDELYEFFKQQAELNGYTREEKPMVAKYLRETLIKMIRDGYYQTIHVPKPSAELLKQLMILNSELHQSKLDKVIGNRESASEYEQRYQKKLNEMHILINAIAKEITSTKPQTIIIGDVA